MNNDAGSAERRVSVTTAGSVFLHISGEGEDPSGIDVGPYLEHLITLGSTEEPLGESGEDFGYWEYTDLIASLDGKPLDAEQALELAGRGLRRVLRDALNRAQ